MNIDIDTGVLNDYELDCIPEYIFYRDILGKTITDKSVKEKILSSELVRKITDQQFQDGSWDCFHTLSSGSSTNLTTENAVRRLLILGLDIDDETIKKAFNYLERYLNKEIDIRDRKEGLSDWTEVTELFAAAWMLEIDSSCEIACSIADRWALLITRCFAGGSFCIDDYYSAFIDIFNTTPGKRAWDIESFHIAAVLKDRLEPEIEERFIDYLLNNENGMYYVSRGRLADLPKKFMSRETSRFLYAHILLSRYRSYRKKCGFAAEWLMKNRGEDGLWDLGPKVKDNVFFPFSGSWRNVIDRRIDSTLFVQKYLIGITD